MAYSIIQSNTTDEATGASPRSATYTNTPAQGNLLMVEVLNDTNSSALTSLKDGNGNSLTLLNSLNRSTAMWTAQYAMIATASQSKTITATLTGASLFLTLYEVSGNFGTIGSIIDNTQATNANFVAGVSNSGSQPSITTTNAGDLIWTTIGWAGGATGTIAVTNSFTKLTANVNAGTIRMNGAYRIPAATGTYNPNWTWTTSRAGTALTTALLPASGTAAANSNFLAFM